MRTDPTIDAFVEDILGSLASREKDFERRAVSALRTENLPEARRYAGMAEGLALAQRFINDRGDSFTSQYEDEGDNL